MDNEEIINSLSAKIKECNEAYKNGDRLISDEEYDSLLEELRLIDPENPLCSKVQSDIGSAKNSKKFDFGNRPMLSLNKVYDVKDLVKWMKSVSRKDGELFYLEPKYDGLSGCADASGVFSTRGDGQTGEIINSKIQMLFIDKWQIRDDGVFIGYREKFKFPENGQIRGEIIFNRNNFYLFQKNIMKKDGNPYKNSRNCISGIMNPTMADSDSKEIADNMEKFNAFASFVCHDEIKIPIEYKAGYESQIESQIEKVWGNFKKNVPYDQDGLVCKLADSEYGDSLGNTGHHPRCGMALKRNIEGKWTKLKDIEWTVGANSELTPTAVVEPIEIDGVEVSHVLLHNLQQIIDRGLMIGCDISIIRSGGVIPKWISNSKEDGVIEENIGLKFKDVVGYGCNDGLIFNKDQSKFAICPCCGSPIIYDYEKSPDCCCSNENCHDRVMKRLYNAVSKCFDIKGLAEETLEKIHEMYHANNFYELFDLSVEQLSMLPGFAMKSAEILFNSIQNARNCTEIQVLSSIGIKLIGRHVASDALSIMPLLRLREASLEDLAKLPAFGPEKTQSLFEGLRRYSSELDELLARVDCKKSFSNTKMAENTGKETICFTGKAPFERSFCQELARKNGYEPVNGVTQGLGVLVMADANSTSSKANKARKYGTKVMTFDEWYASLSDKDEDKSIEGNSAIHNEAVDSIFNNI